MYRRLRFFEEDIQKDKYRNVIKDLFRRTKEKYDEIVFFCIGTPKNIGDSFGPRLGTMLKESGIENVYGTIDEPVIYTNFRDIIQDIENKYKNPLIISIDAMLVNSSESHNSFYFGTGGLIPGSGAHDDSYTRIGNMHLTYNIYIGENSNSIENINNSLNELDLCVIFNKAYCIHNLIKELIMVA